MSVQCKSSVVVIIPLIVDERGSCSSLQTPSFICNSPHNYVIGAYLGLLMVIFWGHTLNSEKGKGPFLMTTLQRPSKLYYRSVSWFGKGSFLGRSLTEKKVRAPFLMTNFLVAVIETISVGVCNVFGFTRGLARSPQPPFVLPASHRDINNGDKSAEVPIPARVYAQFTDSGRSF